MGFKTIHYNITQPIKATHFLLQCGYSKKETQKLLDKRRVQQGNTIIQKSDILTQGNVAIHTFIPNDIHLLPFFACVPPTHKLAYNNEAIPIKITEQPPYFCLFNKPSKLLTHPKNLDDSKSLLDALRYHFGMDSNPCHRLDYETSGLLLCSLDKKSETILKNLFLEHKVKKTYLAIVQGAITQPIMIESAITFTNDFGNLCIQGKAENLNITHITTEQIHTIQDNFIQENTHNKATSILVPLQIFQDFSDLSHYLYSKHNPFFTPQYHDNISTHTIKKYIKNPYNIIIQHKYFWDTHILEETYHTFLLYLQVMPSIDYKKTTKVDSKYYEKLYGYPYNEYNPITTKHNFATQSKTKQNDKQYTLVKLMPLSGKTHQLRIHTASIQHPILGDTLYGLHATIASFFLDIQSKRVKHTIESYLYDNVSQLRHEAIEQHIYMLHNLHQHKSITQKLFYGISCQYILQKYSIQQVLQKDAICQYATMPYRFIAIHLSYCMMPCFFSHAPCNMQDEHAFFTFLLFYYALPKQQARIVQDMRLYYCGTERLLLHASKIELLNKSFICPNS